jgi:hypothetical protein
MSLYTLIPCLLEYCGKKATLYEVIDAIAGG